MFCAPSQNKTLNRYNANGRKRPKQTQQRGLWARQFTRKARLSASAQTPPYFGTLFINPSLIPLDGSRNGTSTTH
jgi:hypothetical protein